MNTKLIELWGNTNKTFMQLLEDMHSEISTNTATESSDIQRLKSQVSAQTSAISSRIGTLQAELINLKNTLFGTLKPTGKFLFLASSTYQFNLQTFSLFSSTMMLKTNYFSYLNY